MTTSTTPLTRMARGAGCGCKLAPGLLGRALASMPGLPADPGILVGHDAMDDAAVYRVSETLAVAATVDFFTPIVDDPATFGAIAATNALSDVYAMGGAPMFALAVTAYPKDGDLDVLGAILRGGAEVALAAGAPVLGGHTVDDQEPKYGLAVVGTVDPDRLMTNGAGEAGDVLVLTKPIGTGVAVAAARTEGAGPAHGRAVAQMLQTNAAAAAAALDAGVRCATDVTGFGLLGHLRELAAASGTGAVVQVDRVPLIDGVRALAAAGHAPGAVDRNRAHLEPVVDLDPGLPAELVTLLFDPQTSGGLLVACPAGRLADLQAALSSRGVTGHAIGSLVPGPAGQITVAAGG